MSGASFAVFARRGRRCVRVGAPRRQPRRRRLIIEILGDANAVTPVGSTPAFWAKIGIGALPVTHAGGPYLGNEGESVTLDASPSFDPDGHPLRRRWDLNNDEKNDLITLAYRQIPRPRARYLYSEEAESCRGQTG